MSLQNINYSSEFLKLHAMKKYFLLFILALSAVITNAQKTIVADANAETRLLSGSFNAIKVSGGIDIYLSQFESESLAVSASEDNYKRNIKTIVENGTLNIYYDSDGGWSKGNKKLKVYISFKNLEKIEAHGASDVHVAGTIFVAKLNLDLSGASDFKGDVAVTELKIDLSGASDVRISGSATNASIESSGASDVKGYDLVTENCFAKASGASDINITVNKELNVNASGASDVFYRGSAVIKDLHTSGASSVARKS